MKEQQSKVAMKYFKKYNKYDLLGNYGICYLADAELKVYFDLEDYDKIKDYCWYKNTNGYLSSDFNNQKLLLHRLVLLDSIVLAILTGMIAKMITEKAI